MLKKASAGGGVDTATSKTLWKAVGLLTYFGALRGAHILAEMYLNKSTSG